jgi:ribosome biogenesis GTPase / thiamine phosphate phosphatase
VAIEDCPRGCGHLGPPADPECALDTLVAADRLRPTRLAALRRVLVALRQ